MASDNKRRSEMAAQALVNGETSKENGPAVNFILGGENESDNPVEENANEYHAAGKDFVRCKLSAGVRYSVDEIIVLTSIYCLL